MEKSTRVVLTPDQVVAFRLGEARRAQGWKQKEAAKQLARFGVRWSRTSYSVAEASVKGTRKKEFSATEIVAIARAFRVPIWKLFVPPPYYGGKPVMTRGHNAPSDTGLDAGEMFEVAGPIETKPMSDEELATVLRLLEPIFAKRPRLQIDALPTFNESSQMAEEYAKAKSVLNTGQPKARKAGGK